MVPIDRAWQNSSSLAHHSYVCGYCNERTGVKVGYTTEDNANRIYLCGGCNRPTFFERGKSQTPSPILGNEVSHLPTDVEALYNEARRCTQAESYTACVLTCRKILMHVAVEKGAEPNQGFFQYVEYLASTGYIPPDGKAWVDHIRKRGNEANHEIVIMSKEAAFELLSFAEMLLKFVYEFPGRMIPPNTTS